MKKKNLAYRLSFFEKIAWRNNSLVCGIDEAGVGPLAGPLVVGAVVIPANKTYKLLKDSKILTEQQRLKAFQWITKRCMYSYAICCNNTIDTLNIYQATLSTMKKAFYLLVSKYEIQSKISYVLVDSMPLILPEQYNALTIKHFNFGEKISPSIAAASIIAKVTRDRIMKSFNNTFPAYNFTQHKGYGTKTHITSLQKIGPSLIHRKSFLTKLTKLNDEQRTQLSLF